MQNFQILANSKTGKPALYIDFSSGISEALNQNSNKQLITECFGIILSKDLEVYKLGESIIAPLSVSNITELGQKIGNNKEYKDKYAPIQKAVEKIIASNNDALLITDFEEWQNGIEITESPFLKLSFKDWLSKGNSIHFFMSAPYKEGNVSKRLYFTIFNCGNPNESSMITKLQAKLSSSLTRYDLTNKSYKLTQLYPSEKSGGIFYDETGKSDKEKNILDIKENYINGLKNGNPFEFYPFGLDWKTIDETHSSYKSQKQFNDFFRKLFINLKDENAYVYGDFDVKVYDVTDDFFYFSKCLKVKDKENQPHLEKGTNGEDKFKDS